MAVELPPPVPTWVDEPCVYVTPAAQFMSSQIWYHFGGYNDGGDCYETQEFEFDREIDGFFQRLLGPYEPLRAKLMDCLYELKGWKSVSIDKNGKMTVLKKNGRREVVLPPDAKKRRRKARA